MRIQKANFAAVQNLPSFKEWCFFLLSLKYLLIRFKIALGLVLEGVDKELEYKLLICYTYSNTNTGIVLGG
jgi:hypothetical protein